MSHKKLGHLATKATEGKIFKCKTVWPFDFFPDTIQLDEAKLTVIHKSFLHKQIITVQLPDLLNVEIFTAPMFATVRVYSKYMTGGHKDIKYVKTQEAFELRDLVNKPMAERNNESNQGGQ